MHDNTIVAMMIRLANAIYTAMNEVEKRELYVASSVVHKV